MPDATTVPLTCKRAGCSRPVFQMAGHRKREYCSDACRQMDYRRRLAGASEKADHRALRRLIVQLEERVQQLEAELDTRENLVRELQARLMMEQCLQADTQVRYFKTWLRKHPQPRDTDFAKRFLSDTRLPQHASHALYEARMRVSGYSEEDLFLFRDAWLRLLLDEEA